MQLDDDLQSVPPREKLSALELFRVFAMSNNFKLIPVSTSSSWAWGIDSRWDCLEVQPDKKMFH